MERHHARQAGDHLLQESKAFRVISVLKDATPVRWAPGCEMLSIKRYSTDRCPLRKQSEFVAWLLLRRWKR